MELLIDISTRFGAGILGLLIYVFLTIKAKAELREFSFLRFWVDNKNRILVSAFIIFLIVLTVTLIPGIASGIKLVLGFDVSGEIASFWSMGYGISSFSKKVVKKNT